MSSLRAIAVRAASCRQPVERYRPEVARGFTLIELLVVLAIIATLLSIAVPKYFHSIEVSKEAVLRHDLRAMRTAIDQYYADRGRYPDDLAELVDRHYLRAIPPDPISESTSSWVIAAPPDGEKGALYDIHSGATGAGSDGTDYQTW